MASRLNKFYWQGEPEITSDQTVTKRITASGLLVFRVISVFLSLATAVMGLIAHPASYFAFISNWAVVATCATFVTLSISHVCQVTRRFSMANTSFEELERVRRSEMRMFKAANILFEVTLTSEIVITFMFWVMLVPKDPSLMTGSFNVFNNLMVHLLMVSLLFTEYVIHRMKFHSRHYAIVVQVALGYMLVNMTCALLGYNVYGWIDTWKDWYTLLFGFVMISVSFVAFYVLKFFEDIKERRVFRHDEKMINLMVSVPSLSSHYTQL